MTIILSTTLSILIFTGLAWAVRKLLRIDLCPVCAGVASTWLWMVGARFAGVAIDITMLEILLGGSAVGLAYQLEKRLPPARSPLIWKTLFIPAGFVAAYGLAAEQWSILFSAAIALVVLMAIFHWTVRDRAKDRGAIERLEQQMKKCC